MTQPLFERHREKLQDAVEAIRKRSHWSAYPEIPSGKIYGENAKKEGFEAYQNRLNQAFSIDQPGTGGGETIGGETSPYGPELGVTYPKPDLDQLIPAATLAMQGWKKASAEQRVGVCLEILDRLNKKSFELANAVMHTTGQGFMMAFQAGGPHAQDRGLEAVAYAWDEMQRTPSHATWSKRVSKTDTIVLDKTYRIVPRGVAVTIGCSTFPTWNSYPGIFASLATGNAVVVKPHPGAILPLAISVEVAREVIQEAGFDPNLVTLCVDSIDEPISKDLVMRPEVKIVDYTGNSEFGDWIEANARQAEVFTEKAGVNSIIIDSLEDLRAVTGNIAFTLCLYSGQMCTTSQNIFIPRDGIETGEGHKSFDEIAGAIVKAVDWFLSDPARASEVLGAIQNKNTAKRIGQARIDGGEVLRDSQPMTNERFPEARVHSPLMLKVDAKDESLFMREMFGPISYLISTDDTSQSIQLASKAASELGAITCALYSTNSDVIDSALDATADAGVPLSCNLTGQIFVNQSAAFSDFHVSGANPSGNATLCDSAYVSRRFNIVQSRIPAPQPAEKESEAHAGV
ncbi:MAG: phenylacetic acid degradation protein PaaN [Planctomycetota bacterium]|nr:phenylacetic acid degradation protein PaaN [Planctomycetota bacterium]